jgi:acyl-coenzyme A thioesterase PaaI-like protein
MTGLHPGFTDPFTQHVEYESIRTSATEASSWIPCRDDLLDDRGSMHPAVIGYLIDSTAGVVCGMAAVPNWVVTTDLEFRLLDLATEGPLRADAVALRPGRRQSLGEVRVFDEGAGDRTVAVGTVNHLVIDRADDLDVPANMPIGVRYGPATERVAPPIAALRDHFGVRRGDQPGVSELDVEGVAVNPLGILHGGLIALLAVEAARDACAGASVTDMVLRFVGSLPKQRVARAVAEQVESVQSSRQLCRVLVSDPADERQRIGALVSVGLDPHH